MKKRYFVYFEGGAADPERKGHADEHRTLGGARWWCRLMQSKRAVEPKKGFARPLAILRVKMKEPA
jgi:hypothetical protein